MSHVCRSVLLLPQLTCMIPTSLHAHLPLMVCNTTWHCSKFEGSFTKCDYRYILRLQLHDHIGHLENVVAFDETANGLLGISTEELFLLSTDPRVVLDIYSRIKGRQFLFTLSLKRDTFNGIERVRPTLMHAEDLPCGNASKILLHVLQPSIAPANKVCHLL